jgi:FkbM family methyltransferase
MWSRFLAALTLATIFFAWHTVCDEVKAAVVPPTPPHNVLVLGSGGLVGRQLTKELKRRGLTVLQVPGRLHSDLRIAGTLAWLDEVPVHFVFFLACEVGGSKFLTSARAQDAVRLYNERMYENVFPWLRARQAPFLFASSMLAVTNSTYGTIKSRGEALTKASAGKSFRLYNVYGREPISAKSHVLSDWTYACIKRGSVVAHTDGTEERQFSHANDVAVALSDMMAQYHTLEDLTEVTTGEWSTLRAVSRKIENVTGGSCEFNFSSTKSTLSRGIEPTNVWRVVSPLSSSLGDLYRFYRMQVEREMMRGAPYLSVVVPALAGTDEILGEFARHTFATSQSAHLDVEVVAVDCAPKFNAHLFETNDVTHDLPVAQRYAWLKNRELGDFHVISWSNQTNPCKWDVVGLRHARGAHVLFTDTSMRFSSAFMEQLSLKRLPARPVGVRALTVRGNSDCTASCSQLGACRALDKQRCLLSVADQTRSAKESGVSGAVRELRIQPRLLIRQSLRENPNTFIDSSVCFVKALIEVAVALPAASLTLPAGIDQQALVFSLLRPVDSAYNPEEPLRSFQHSPLFQKFTPFWAGVFNGSWLVDFLGTHTAYEYDCENIERYRIWHLSRRIPCARHDLFRAADVRDVVIGELPIVDEEYFEWLPLLRATTLYAQLVQKGLVRRPFGVVEFGARYGTWVVRGGMAARRLVPEAEVHLLAVEADQTCYQWLINHLRENRFDNGSAVRGFVSDADGSATFSAWERQSPSVEEVPSYAIGTLLANFSVVDMIHCDIQGAESAFLNDKIIAVLSQKAKTIHFGTHGADLHEQLLLKFTAKGWRIVENMQFGGGKLPGRIEPTPHGPIRILWDGMLTVENPALSDA